MTKPKKKKLNQKKINIAAIETNARKFIENHPIYSAMYHEEIIAKRIENKNKKLKGKK